MSKVQDIIEKIKAETKAEITTADDPKLKFVRVPFGISELDKILGGGFIKGKTHLLKGAWSSGKTFLALIMIKNVQQSGGIVAFVDVEKTFDPDWAAFLGITKDLIVCQPTFGEQALDVVIGLIKANVGVVVLDSVGALVSVAEQEDDMTKAHMAPQARMVNEALKKITSFNNETVFIAINQEREGISGGPFKSTVLPAGKGQWFYSSIILDVGRGDWIKDSENNRLGFYIKCFTTKNKTAPEQQQCVLPFVFGQGIDAVLGVFSAAVDAGSIQKQKNTFVFEGEKLGTRNAALEVLRANTELLARIKLSIP